ncbi:efflux RND transporter periplasmic adaptor subunit [Chitinophaga rhizophila]|uniref:Efflux RND transporter periplasmic adaptor subunit n=1 Tax=Chitinophaga rhizophila TaxID=2866212 RepID=A0ABS7GGD4_9BACT|nr:efflux RND transporter periplasmic adaptor subunit [Chitinophaga rhizophila]MBW8686753.1 efflux RND transporter periplasmic adaptor subunit [Chitinophaga rhizophila]
MKCNLPLIVFLAAGLTLSACRHSEIEEGATDKTFVLSDTMLETIRIDTASLKPVEKELQLPGKVIVNSRYKQKTDVLIDVAEADLESVKEGYEAQIVTESLPEKVFYGKVEYVYPPNEASTGRLSIVLNDPEELLKPDMKAAVTVHCDEGDDMIAIPETAVIADHSKNFVLVFKDKYNIQVREIVTYTTAGAITYILSGLDAGENVISAHQRQIYDALSDN